MGCKSLLSLTNSRYKHGWLRDVTVMFFLTEVDFLHPVQCLHVNIITRRLGCRKKPSLIIREIRTVRVRIVYAVHYHKFKAGRPNCKWKCELFPLEKGWRRGVGLTRYLAGSTVTSPASECRSGCYMSHLATTP